MVEEGTPVPVPVVPVVVDVDVAKPMTTWLERVRATDEDLAAERPSKVLRSVKMCMCADIDMETED